MSKQLALQLPKRGGRREGAGRPRTRPHPELRAPGVPHLRRESIAARHPVHVTMRLLSGVGYLRARRRTKLLEAAFREARLRFGMRIVHYSIQGNHLHLIVEVESAPPLRSATCWPTTAITRSSICRRAGKTRCRRRASSAARPARTLRWWSRRRGCSASGGNEARGGSVVGVEVDGDVNVAVGDRVVHGHVAVAVHAHDHVNDRVNLNGPQSAD